MPRVTFTAPEVASVGITERQAHDRGITVETVTQDVTQTARGYIHGETGGLIKLIPTLIAGSWSAPQSSARVGARCSPS